MAHTLSNSESESGFGSESEEEYEVYSNISRYDLITFIHDLMSHCQNKARQMKAVKKQLDFLKEELKYSKETIETLERNLATEAKKDSKEPLNEQDMVSKIS